MAAHSLNSSLRDLSGEGWIGPVYCAGREILRRIFVTVRDRNWQEVRPSRFDCVIDDDARVMRLSARHTNDLVDFEWHGELTANEDCSELRFAFQGQALRDMDVCRLGLIVLHPVDAMVGARVTASSQQINQAFTIEKQLAPQPIVNGIPGAMTEPFTELVIERDDWRKLALSFVGDSFELEDQRNWGDASFKTYCTPLRKGFPRTVKQGTSISHSVRTRFTPVTSTLGVMLPSSAGRLQHQDANWHHVHVDLTGQDLGALRRALESTSNRQLEIALEATTVGPAVREWANVLRAHRERVARILFFGRDTALPSAPMIELWRDALAGSTGDSIPLFAATRGYFVEFNRSVAFNLPVDGIAFPLTATVHSDDAETVMSNVGAVRDMAQTGRRIADTSKIALVPLAFRYPPNASAARPSSELILNWLAATLRHAVGAGVTSITLADDLVEILRSDLRVGTAEELLHLLVLEKS